jgi:hypothetical protein
MTPVTEILTLLKIFFSPFFIINVYNIVLFLINTKNSGIQKYIIKCVILLLKGEGYGV